jgi:predicted thioesterase
MRKADLAVQNEGTLFLLRGISDAGREWVEKHLPDDVQTWGDAVIVEHRYIEPIVTGAIADGLQVV